MPDTPAHDAAAVAPAPDRITVEEVIALARRHGLPGIQLFVVVSTPVAGWGPIHESADVHLAHQIALEAEGVMFGAGPLCTEDGYAEGEGLFIIRADSMEEARQIADRDPLHKSGARTYHIRPWILCEGSVSLTVRLSGMMGALG